MPSLGWQELVIILIIVIVIFGAGKLPEIGTGLGRGIRGFKEESGIGDEKDKKDGAAIEQGTSQTASTLSDTARVERVDEKVDRERTTRADDI